MNNRFYDKAKMGYSTLSFINKEDIKNIDEMLVTSVHIFPIKGEDVLFTVNPRGIDIIGGHVEKNEDIYWAMMRELWEEANVSSNVIEVIGGIKIDNSQNPEALKKYPAIGYQVFFKTSNVKEYEFNQTHECTGREWVNRNNVGMRHHNWLDVHQQLLESMF